MTLRRDPEGTRRRILEAARVEFAGEGPAGARVDRVARGRVWTGEEAVDRKLVDRLGGLRTAVLEGKRLVGLDEDAAEALDEAVADRRVGFLWGSGPGGPDRR